MKDKHIRKNKFSFLECLGFYLIYPIGTILANVIRKKDIDVKTIFLLSIVQILTYVLLHFFASDKKFSKIELSKYIILVILSIPISFCIIVGIYKVIG